MEDRAKRCHSWTKKEDYNENKGNPKNKYNLQKGREPQKQGQPKKGR